MGECSKGMSGKAGIPPGSYMGLCGSMGSFTQCMAAPLPWRRLVNNSNGVQKKEIEKVSREEAEPERAISEHESVRQTQKLLRNTEQGLDFNLTITKVV